MINGHLIATGFRLNDESDRVEERYQGSATIPDQAGRVQFDTGQMFSAPSTGAGAVRVNGVGEVVI